jgi:chemotaxis protein CheZ
LEGFGAFAPFRKILGKRINIGSGKKVFTAERYNKWRGFSMAVKTPGASSGGDSPSVDNAEVLIAIEELRQEIADLKNGGINVANAPQQAVYEIDEEVEADVRLEIAQMVRSIGKTKSELAAIQHPM